MLHALEYLLLPSGVVRITDPYPLRLNRVTAPTADHDPPVFNLTCISAGGPATTVTWTRDGAPASGVTSQTVVDQQTATYHNTLTVTGRLFGNYRCTITNARTLRHAGATASLMVTATGEWWTQ